MDKLLPDGCPFCGKETLCYHGYDDDNTAVIDFGCSDPECVGAYYGGMWRSDIPSISTEGPWVAAYKLTVQKYNARFPMQGGEIDSAVAITGYKKHLLDNDASSVLVSVNQNLIAFVAYLNKHYLANRLKQGDAQGEK